MTRDEVFTFAEQVFKRSVEAARAKNNDYTKASDDPFFNLRRGGVFGIGVRMDDKVSRILSLSRGDYDPQVQDESLEDTLMDLFNYAWLALAFIEEGKRNDS